MVSFEQAREFFLSWGLDAEDEYAYAAYPSVFGKMMREAEKVGGYRFKNFVNFATNTTDGKTYIRAMDWAEFKEGLTTFYRRDSYNELTVPERAKLISLLTHLIQTPELAKSHWYDHEPVHTSESYTRTYKYIQEMFSLKFPEELKALLEELQ